MDRSISRSGAERQIRSAGRPHGRGTPAFVRPNHRLADRRRERPAEVVAEQSIAVVDTGLCNLDSMLQAIERCGGRAVIARDPSVLEGARRVILPGVGSFAVAMDHLERGGCAEALRRIAAGGETLILGVCVGMQVLADAGTEGGERCGLGLLPGTVRRLRPESPGERLPHVGWNTVEAAAPCPLFAGVPRRADFYFVHSYHLVPDCGDIVAGTTPYCGGFVSAVHRGTVFGTQFHVEKSQAAGLRVLANFLSLTPEDAAGGAGGPAAEGPAC